MGYYDVSAYSVQNMFAGMMSAGTQICIDSLRVQNQMLQCLAYVQAQSAESSRQAAKRLANFSTKPLFNLQQTSSYNGTSGIFGSTSQTGTASVSSNYVGKTIKRNNSEYGPAFLARVKEIASRLNCDYRDLLAVMNSESGIRADAKNPHGSATGLIQFVESTARGLGTTTSALRTMSPLKQLDYVEKYLVRAKNRQFSSSHKLTAGELYALVFLPARANREVLTSSGERFYAANRGLDKNKDGKITKTELSQQVVARRVSDNSFLV